MSARNGRGHVDFEAMKKAVAGFLRAAGQDPTSKTLRATPALVARAWRDEFLEGYRVTRSEVLKARAPRNGKGPELVVLEHIDYVSMCPHHLLPSKGVASVAYVPGRWLIGLGQLARLVDVCAHRLVLQEDLAREVAEALMHEIGAKGAGCVLEAEHACLQARGEKRRRAVLRTESFAGSLSQDLHLQRRLVGRRDSGRVR